MKTRFATTAVVAALIALGAPAGAMAEDVTVNRLDDLAGAECPDDCTLRAALDQIEQDQQITLPAGHYVLTQRTALVFPVDIFLVGAGARTTIIDAGGTSRVGYLDGPFAVNVMISGVTITGGDADAGGDDPDIGEGGAFRLVDDAELTLVDSAVVGNGASITGGGISSLGEVHVEHSLIANNRVASGGAPIGGGIYAGSGGSLQVLNSTLSGNTVTDTDGADALGGGIYSEDQLDLEHTTIAANRAVAGGGLYQATVATVDKTMANTLVAGNTGGACGGHPDLIVTDHSLADDATCALQGPADLPSANAKLAPLANYGGPTNTHALYTGSQAINGSNNCGDPDQRRVVRSAAPCDIGAFEGSIPPPSGPPSSPPPAPPKELPPPVAGKKVNALTKSGTVKVKVPGTSTFVVLGDGKQIPVGTTVDTLKGRVTLVAAANKTGGTATAVFYEGIFKISQTKGSKPITTLTLVEKLSCARAGQAIVAKKKKKKRHLWGDGKGRFRTTGSYSSATVRGTKWLVEDRCTSTLTKVARGKVAVRDFVKRKTVLVRAGKQYVAKRKK